MGNLFQKEDILDSLSNCKFCTIYNCSDELTIHRTENTFAFHDIKKAGAKEHILVCPKMHYKHVGLMRREHIPLLKEIKLAADEIVAKLAPGQLYL